MKRLKILVLEPYFGGSHKTFLEGLQKFVPFEYELLTLPARAWKWRMRLAAPFFAEKIGALVGFDRLLCSAYVDVAALRGLLPAGAPRLPIFTYFHENQFVYPLRIEAERDYHFALTNLTTALAADRLAFNSAYNLGSFLDGAARLWKMAPDMKSSAHIEELIRARARILPPGIDFSRIDAEPVVKKNRVPVIIWNHRWEHDKNPELFFECMFALDHLDLDFELIILGEDFGRQPAIPAIFARARAELAHRIIHMGYVESRREYARLLRRGDLVVSTAGHEFFGIAVLEAVRAGCRPLLPKRLSYPELFPAEFLYEEQELLPRLTALLRQGGRLPVRTARTLTDRFSWHRLAGDYEKWLAGQ